MKKLLVIGIVATMVMGLALAAVAAPATSTFVKDTSWTVYFSLNNGIYNSGTRQYGYAGQDVSLGNAAAESTSNGGSYSSTSAIVRDLSATGGGYGLSANLKVALDQKPTAQIQEWGSIALFTGGAYTAANLKFMVWSAGVDPLGPELKLVCTQAATGSGFSVGDVVFDYNPWVDGGSTMPTAAKNTPFKTIDLTSYKSAYLTATAGAPAATFKFYAITPGVPEPGSMVALLSGLVGLVGFGIRRRK